MSSIDYDDYSYLDIFEVKEYGDGDICPYLNPRSKKAHAEILEESKEQFLRNFSMDKDPEED